MANTPNIKPPRQLLTSSARWLAADDRQVASTTRNYVIKAYLKV